ncbi:MAG TPA: energy transducer TonB [bacterium]
MAPPEVFRWRDWLQTRAYEVAFCVSLALHALVLAAATAAPLRFLAESRAMRAIEVVYEHPPSDGGAERLEQELARAKPAEISAPIPAADVGGVQVRIPDRPSLVPEAPPEDLPSAGRAVIDLTNLIEAAQGNPVLLSYFGAIREQIQRSANAREWLTGEEQEGLVCVSFVLRSDGSLKDRVIVASRSVDSAALRDIAMRIVEAAGPFPAFPPSMEGESRTIVVPLEFLTGS